MSFLLSIFVEYRGRAIPLSWDEVSRVVGSLLKKATWRTRSWFRPQRISQVEVVAGFGGVGIGQRMDEPVRVDIGSMSESEMGAVLTSSL